MRELGVVIAAIILVVACGRPHPIGSGQGASSSSPSPITATPATSASTVPPSSPPVGNCSGPPGCLPQGRGEALAFDDKRAVLFTFGGVDQAIGRLQVLAETWEWKEGQGWAERHPIHSPAARSAPVLVYDRLRGTTLLYGGRDFGGQGFICGEFANNNCASDTWTWDGQDWKELHPLHSPKLFVPTGAYDSARSRVVLFSVFSPDTTWIWDGADWSRLSGPPPRRGHHLL